MGDRETEAQGSLDPEGSRLLARANLFYIGGNLLSRIGVLVSLPLVLRLLTKQEYGLIVLAEVIGVLLAGIGGAQLDQSLTRLYHEWPEDEKEPLTRALLNRHVLIALLVLAVGLGGIVLYGALTEAGSDVSFPLALALSGYYLTFVTPLALFAWFRISQDVVRFFSFNLGRFLGIQGGAVAAAFMSADSFLGYLGGTLFLAAVFNLGSLFYCWRVLPARAADKGRLKETMVYGLPLVSSNFLQVLQSVADRILVQALLGLEALSIYAVAARIVSLLANVHEAIKLNYVPQLFKYASDRIPARLQQVKRNALAGLEVLFGVGFLLVAFTEPLVWLLGGVAYVPAALYAPGLVWAGYVGSVVLYVAPGIVLEKRTQWAVIPAILQITSMVVCAWLLAPRFGLLGILLGKIVASMLYLGGHIFSTQRLNPSLLANLPVCRLHMALLALTSAALTWLASRSLPLAVELAVYGFVTLLAVMAGLHSRQLRRVGATG